MELVYVGLQMPFDFCLARRSQLYLAVVIALVSNSLVGLSPAVEQTQVAVHQPAADELYLQRRLLPHCLTSLAFASAASNLHITALALVAGRSPGYTRYA